ncbi:biotin--[acetyl-CoA-carboxylase] ligase [Guyparkeria sp. SCN-R1]|uniref:biotin--[acetyl-CoA-carboxylase] ligase n=1 Tax=Guyparkeria sp. SCN-R1 TaxID=2341113 RepID=UPI000F65317F|nr:biotin--[acetyl-CoA-carboxylase] ligase [Guyparkeria sp. SCN-R1]RRQ20305.1 biotin--[acetyl-CoA-carboxylase] ligase [Guyparkeria sp. SCN-R1]
MHRDAALDFDPLARQLQRLAARRGWVMAARASVDSTNDRVRALVESAEGGARAPVVVVAAEQTAGVGRRGARWLSAPGDGLWFSLVVPAGPELPDAPPGLALAGRLAGVLQGQGVPATVKWPNDLYLDEGKLGGLMIERRRVGGEVCWLAGVGINWRRPAGPLDAEYRASAISEAGDGWQGDSIALALALVEAAVIMMSRPADWPGEMAGLSRRHHGFGKPVAVEHGNGARTTGIAGVIRPDGDLDITRSDGRVIRAGAHDRVRVLLDRAGNDSY